MVGKAGKFRCHDEDVNDDLLDDLICQVETAGIFNEVGESASAPEAETFEGRSVYGEDFHRVVPDNWWSGDPVEVVVDGVMH